MHSQDYVGSRTVCPSSHFVLKIVTRTQRDLLERRGHTPKKKKKKRPVPASYTRPKFTLIKINEGVNE